MKYLPLKKSIGFTLLGWFLALSLIPLILVSWYSHDSAVESMEKMQRNKLKDTASINVRFVNDWFEQTRKNLEFWSKFAPTKESLKSLVEAFKKSGLKLDDFIKSPHYKRLLSSHDNQLKEISENYEYVYDLFLIDTSGNILYTVAKESDLGTNLLIGPYAATRFAQTYRKVLLESKPHFSDLERYAPSNGTIAGFICVPMYDTAGEVTGIIALQIKLEAMFERFDRSNTKNSGVKHYLVGNDGLLRTQFNSPDEILSRRINTEQFWKWYNEHGLLGTFDVDMTEEAFTYTGPNENLVFGQHSAINLLGTRWVHISEIDTKILTKEATSLATNIALIIVLAIVFIIAASFYITKRITQPIKKLNSLVFSYMNEKEDTKVIIDSNNEVGVLSQTFQRMIDNQKEDKLQLKKLLIELQQQKYAFDAHSIVAMTDLEGNITFVNKKFEEISGYSSEELIGANHRILNSGLHPLSFWKVMYKTVSQGKIWHGIVRNRAKNGEYYWVDTTIVPYMDENNKPTSYIAIRTDITDQKETELALSQAINLKKSIFENSGNAIITTDTSGLITAFNAAAEQILGYSAHEVVGKQSPAIFHKLEEVVSRAKEFSAELNEPIEPGFKVFTIKAEKRLPNSHIWTYVHKDGHEFPVTLNVTALYAEDEKIIGYMGIADDISKFKEAEQKVIEAKDAAEASSRSKSEFLANMSHELRTPLTAILGFSSIMEKKAEDEESKRHIGLIKASSNQLLSLVNDILDISKIQSGKFTIDPHPFIGIDEMEGLIHRLDALVSAKLLQFSSTLDDSLRHTFNGDWIRISQIISNLISNAIKFTAKNGYITYNAYHEKGNLHISISDTGIGMSEEAKDRIFKPFEQADGSTTRKYGGTGLGLSITQRLIEMMEGTIEVESTEGEGSTFSVTLPIPITEDSLSKDSCELSTPSALFTGHALVAEDNMTNQILIRILLEDKGLTCDFADNGEIALKMYDPNIYDIVFMDENMPVMNGLRAFELIKERHGDKRGPVVALTANAVSGAKETFIDAGMDDYISKPIDVEELQRILSRFLV